MMPQPSCPSTITTWARGEASLWARGQGAGRGKRQAGGGVISGRLCVFIHGAGGGVMSGRLCVFTHGSGGEGVPAGQGGGKPAAVWACPRVRGAGGRGRGRMGLARGV